MYLPNTRGQNTVHPKFDASGKITLGGTPQLLLPRHKSRSMFIVVNLSAADTLYIEFGSARATATIANAGAKGTISGFSITNGGFGFTRPPKVLLLGGGYGGNQISVPSGQPGEPAPGDAMYAQPQSAAVENQKPALASAVLTGGVVTSLVINDPGYGYGAAPYVYMQNDDFDPFGCASPFYSSALSGIPISPGGAYYVNGTACTTDPIAIYGATTNDSFTCKWMA